MIDLGKKVEKNIRKNTVNGVDQYYVLFNFRNIHEIKSFPTLEDARAYRDAVNAEKLRVKTEETLALIRKAELKDICKEEPYPYNALEKVGIMDYDVPSEFAEEEFFENVLRERCNEREENAIIMFFKHKMTYARVGQHLGVSLERVRQIVYKALKKVKFYMYHYEAIKEKEEKQVLLREESDKLDARRAELIKVCKETGIIPEDVTIYFGRPELVEDESNLTETEKALKHYSIADLDLSVRSYNCLKRARIQYLSELINMTESDMMKIRNLGKKSLREIKGKLCMYGLDFKEDK